MMGVCVCRTIVCSIKDRWWASLPPSSLQPRHNNNTTITLKSTHKNITHTHTHTHTHGNRQMDDAWSLVFLIPTTAAVNSIRGMVMDFNAATHAFPIIKAECSC